MPRPTEDEYRLLKEDVQAHGVHTPVVVNPAHELLDGYTRAQVAGELGIADLLVKVDPPRDPLTEREYVIRANLTRRHLTGSQKDKLGLALRDIGKERAAQRQIDAGKRGKEGGRGHKKTEGETLAQDLAQGFDNGRELEKAGKAVARSPESLRKADRIERAIIEHPEWAELKTQWEQAQLGNDSTDATYPPPTNTRGRERVGIEIRRSPTAYGAEATGPIVPAPPGSRQGVARGLRVRTAPRPERLGEPGCDVAAVRGRRKSTYGGVSPENYVDWFLPIADEIHRVLRPDGSFVLVMKEGATDGQRDTYVIELVLALRSRGWRWVEDTTGARRTRSRGSGPTGFRAAGSTSSISQRSASLRCTRRLCASRSAGGRRPG